MVAAFLMFGTAGAGFAGAPWFAFGVGAFLMVALCIPEKIQTLRRYAGAPATDIVMAMVFELAMNVAGAFVSAWAGYGLRLVLMFLTKHR